MKPRFGLGRPHGTAGSHERESDTRLSLDDGDDFGADEGISPAVDLPSSGNAVPVRPDLGPPAPGPQSANQPGSGLGLVISVAVSAAVFVLAIYATGSPTANPLPLAQTTNALFWVVGALATAAAGIGAEYADRTAARPVEQRILGRSSLRTAWIVPVVATATAIVLVATFHNTTMIVAGPLIAFLGNAGALLSRDLLDDADDSAQRTATTIHAVVIHAVAFLALSAIYLNKLSAPITALLAATMAALLTTEALDRAPGEEARKSVFALLAAGAVAAAAVPLTWWLTHGWTGGAVLFVVFYCAVGVLQTGAERGGLRLRDAIEYGLIPLGALLILAITA
jgi:hypothetical protein